MRVLATLGLASSLAACNAGPDVGKASAGVSTTGTVTALCGHPSPLPTGFTGFSLAPDCAVTCSSGGIDGYCQNLADAQSHIEVHGCPDKTDGEACDAATNGGVLLAEIDGADIVSFADFSNDTQWCTFQLAVLAPDPDDPIGLKDFIVWQRDECDSASPTGGDPPVAACEADSVCAPDGQCVADASIDSGSYDPDGDAISTAQDPPGPYGLGTTDVTLTVSDGELTATCSAEVTVDDCEAPEIQCPDAVVAECTGDASALVDAGDATAYDRCSEIASLTDPGPATYPLGTTEVEYSATDEAGNLASCTTTVTVEDTTPPAVTTGGDATLCRRNGGYQAFTLADCQAVIIDGCEGELPPGSAEITCVTSDEPENGVGDGNTVDDIVIVDGQTVLLRGERAGPGDGRVYSIEFAVHDSAGNTATGVCKIGVPHGNCRVPPGEGPPVYRVGQCE